MELDRVNECITEINNSIKSLENLPNNRHRHSEEDYWYCRSTYLRNYYYGIGDLENALLEAVNNGFKGYISKDIHNHIPVQSVYFKSVPEGLIHINTGIKLLREEYAV